MNSELSTRLDKIAAELCELRKLVVADRMEVKVAGVGILDLPINIYPKITKLVAERLGVSLESIFGSSRIRSVVDARHVAMWICYQVPRSTLVEIGMFFSKDHGSVHHAVNQIHGERAVGSAFSKTADELLDQCQKEFLFVRKL